MIELWRWPRPRDVDHQPGWEVTVFRPEWTGVDLRVGLAWDIRRLEWTVSVSALALELEVWHRRQPKRARKPGAGRWRW